MVASSSSVDRRGGGWADRLGAAVLLLVATPLLVVLWVAVRLDTPGPGFCTLTRVGREGRSVQLVTLRTMHDDVRPLLEVLADEYCDVAVFTIRRDPRVTRVGYWLRRWSLDELPALVNVVRGEIPMLGPRPVVPVEVPEGDG